MSDGCGTFRVCECGHVMGLHESEAFELDDGTVTNCNGWDGHFGPGCPPVGTGRCLCPGFRQRPDLERAAYERAMRGEA